MFPGRRNTHAETTGGVMSIRDLTAVEVAGFNAMWAITTILFGFATSNAGRIPQKKA